MLTMLDPFVNCKRPLTHIINNLIILYTTREWLIIFFNAPNSITVLQNILGAVQFWGKLIELDKLPPHLLWVTGTQYSAACSYLVLHIVIIAYIMYISTSGFVWKVLCVSIAKRSNQKL
jgi:hypothetical protein